MNDIDKKKSMEGGMEIFARASNYLGDIAKVLWQMTVQRKNVQ